MKKTLLLLVCLSLLGCIQDKRKQWTHFKEADDFHIEALFYGGMVGSFTYNFHIMNYQGQSIMIVNEGMPTQTYMEIDDTKRLLLDSFLVAAMDTHLEDRTYIVSCIAGAVEAEYTFKDKGTSLVLKPDINTTSLFRELTDELTLVGIKN